jgi:hypothetical protein
MNRSDYEQFLQLYEKFRYQDQLAFYQNRQHEFEKALTQATMSSIGLLALAAFAGILALIITVPSVQIICLLLLAIFPSLSTALSAYSAYYSFGQQAKLYRDVASNLLRARALSPDLIYGASEAEFAEQVVRFVNEVEHIYLIEEGQWGLLVMSQKPAEER